MKTLVVYSSQTENTKKLANAAYPAPDAELIGSLRIGDEIS